MHSKFPKYETYPTMNKRTFTVDIEVLYRMKKQREYCDKTVEELIRLIRIGVQIMEEDKRILRESGYLRSHYHLPENEKEAMSTAAYYRILKEESI